MMRFQAGFLLLLLPVMLSAQPRNGLTAEFTFNQKNGRNTAGGPDAIVKGAYPSEDRFGNKGYCFFLQGNQDSYIDLGNGPHVKPERGTISLWVEIDQAIYKGEGVEHNPILYTKSHAGDDFNEAFFVGYHFNLRKLSANNSGSKTEQINLYPANTIYFREWYHVVLSFDDSLSRLYLNGELSAEGQKGFRSHYMAGDPVLVGVREGPKNKRYLQGRVDDIRFYDRVLSQEEIQQLYNEPDPNRTAVIVRWVLLFAFISVVVALLLRVIRLRVNKALRLEQEKNKVRNRGLEQEIKMLKAQMNPHSFSIP
jgi:hypothetical protein